MRNPKNKGKYSMLPQFREGKQLAYLSHYIVLVRVYILSFPDSAFQPCQPHAPQFPCTRHTQPNRKALKAGIVTPTRDLVAPVHKYNAYYLLIYALYLIQALWEKVQCLCHKDIIFLWLCQVKKVGFLKAK